MKNAGAKDSYIIGEFTHSLQHGLPGSAPTQIASQLLVSRIRYTQFKKYFS
jgi:cell division protein FtsX